MNIFFDMDGTLSVFNKEAGPDVWSAPGYARTLEKLNNVVGACKQLLKEKTINGEKINVYICSAVVSMAFAVEDKKYWLKEMGIDIPKENMIFVPYGQSKKKAIEEAGVTVRPGDVFLDDYTNNLVELTQIKGLIPIKLLNGINDTHKSWKGARVSAFSDASEITTTILGISLVSRAA
jgi:5'(3')-deoxyribonucleotidase